MNKLLVLSVAAVLILSIIVPLAIAGKGGTKGPNECKDGIDNDNDGLIDWPADPGCDSKNDNDEWNFIEPYCGDGECNGDETCETCETDCGHCDSCTDTDGLQYYFQGTVSGYYNTEPYEYTDYCHSETQVVEYYCIGDLHYSLIHNCLAGNWTELDGTCVNGACI